MKRTDNRSNIKDVLKKYPKGTEIPFLYHEKIIGIIAKSLPEIDSRIRMFEKVIRIERVFGNTIIEDHDSCARVSIQSKDGLILKAFINTIVKEKGKRAGCINRSILNPSIKLSNKSHSKQEQSIDN